MISVCMATYNGEKYIFKQLESILMQLGELDEIVVSDDSSTDNTLNIIKSFNDNRIKIFSDQKFKNPIFNFENAINRSVGENIFLSDQDDIWHPQKIEKLTDALKYSDLVVCDCSFINDKDEFILKSYFELVGSGSGVLKNLNKNTYFGCCMAFKRCILAKALPFPKQIPMHDIWLGFVGDLFYKTCFLKEPLTYYRKHDNNASNASEITSSYDLVKKIMFRINLLKYIPRTILK